MKVCNLNVLRQSFYFLFRHPLQRLFTPRKNLIFGRSIRFLCRRFDFFRRIPVICGCVLGFLIRFHDCRLLCRRLLRFLRCSVYESAACHHDAKDKGGACYLKRWFSVVSSFSFLSFCLGVSGCGLVDLGLLIGRFGE